MTEEAPGHALSLELFSERFHDATVACREIAQFAVEEALPRSTLFNLTVNLSDTRIPLLPDEVLLNDVIDGQQGFRCPATKIVSLLWREGRVPEWINVRVVAITGTATIVEVVASNRFTANAALLYHQDGSCAPFHALEPMSPVGRESGQRFSLFQECSCATLAEIRTLQDHSIKIQKVELLGDAIDDNTLDRMPSLPNLYALELNRTRVRGIGLMMLDRFPALGVLKVVVARPEEFAITRLPELASLTTVVFENLPSHPWGGDWVIRRAPNLDSIYLRAAGNLVLMGSFPTEMKAVSIRCAQLQGDIGLPEKVKDLRLHMEAATSHDLDRLLRSAFQIEHLSLGRTELDDEQIQGLVSRLSTLRTLQVSGISTELRRHLSRVRPGLVVR